VSPHEKVARWARRPIALGESEGSVFVPLVVGPDDIAWVTDPKVTRACPELGVLSVLAHGRAQGELERDLPQVERTACGRLRQEEIPGRAGELAQVSIVESLSR